MMRKICVVTGSRADYGLLRWVMKGIQESSELELLVVATGMHLSPEFGLTYQEIEKDGFTINFKIEMLLSSDTPLGITNSMGLGLIGFGEALRQLKPDIVLILGDRFEILSAAISALIANIPLAHLHGGELTQGAFDEAIRHSITKMSHLHFVAAEEYRKRVIQLGENPKSVFLVGGLGIDNIKKMELLSRTGLEKALGFNLGKKNLLITLHPTTLEPGNSEKQMCQLLMSLEKLEDTHLIFTMPNADTEGRIIFNMIERFVNKNDNARAYASLGQLRYLSCIEHVDGVIGNSSSGIIETPSFNKGTVNIGDRQLGRLKAKSIIDCSPDNQSITTAIKRLYSLEFQSSLKNVENPYGNGGASEKIVEVIKEHSLESLIKKPFYNM